MSASNMIRSSLSVRILQVRHAKGRRSCFGKTLYCGPDVACILT